MYRKIDRLFHDQLAIDGVYTNLLDIPQKETIDLLLSSRPFQIPLPYRTIEISSMVSCNDEQRISEAIHQLHETNYRRTAEKLLLHYFKKDLFFIEEETWEPKALLHRLCERMRAAGYVDERFETSILEREKISSSCFGKIAIPHPLDNIYAHSAIATLIARRPIPWGENQVQIVIMLSISEKDKQEFSDLFEMITHSINDDAHYHQLLSAANYDDFLRIVLEKNNSLS